MRITGIPYRTAFYLWRLVPVAARERVTKRPSLMWAKNVLRDSLAMGGDRDDIYNATYYDYVDFMASKSAASLSRMIVDEFRPQTAVDVGCGTGAILAALQDQGVSVLGLEYSRVAVAICARRGLDVRIHDIEGNSNIDDLGSPSTSSRDSLRV
jgi:SAM-dependent methyltransferase